MDLKKLKFSQRIRLSLLIGFAFTLLFTGILNEETSGLSFLFPEISLSPSVSLSEQGESENGRVIEVEDEKKPEVRFFIIELFKGIFSD